MNNNKFKTFLSILGYVFLLLILILFFSLNWFETKWGDITIETAIYQLDSPLKGTPTNIIMSYITACIFTSIAVILIILFLKLLSDNKKNIIKYTIRFKNHIKTVAINSKHFNILRVLTILIILIYSSSYIYSQYERLKIGRYLESINNASTIFEDKYVNPSPDNVFFPNQKHNLILIYLESMESTYTSRENGGGKDNNYIKALQELAFSNISFSNTEKLGGPWQCYGTGWTIAALLSSSSGVPYKLPVGGNDADKYEYFLPGLITLGDVLKANNYRNFFMCGTDVDFAGRKQFYEQHGDYTIYDIASAINDNYASGNENYWGLNDSTLYSYAKDKLAEIAQNNSKPFNFTMLTVDTHHEEGFICDLCNDNYPEKYANVIECASKQASDFIKWCQNQSWYKNTTIVILGDHQSMAANFWDDINGYDRRAYNCFINSVNDCSIENMHNRTFTSMDYFPTIISSIGGVIENEYLGLGTNLFSGKKTLAEELGCDDFEYQLSLYSKYYNDVFVSNNR